jgi:hypothetical protein
MLKPSLTSVLGACLLGGLASQAVALDSQAILNAHNNYRAKHCVPALSWSPQLAQGAQAWADACPQNGFKHSPDAWQGANPYGENLAWGTNLTPQGGVDLWYNEIKQYNFAAPTYSNAVGHFTQLIWKGSTQVGCGMSVCNGMNYYVCRYLPSGNMNVSTQFVSADQARANLMANVPALCNNPTPPPPPPNTGGNNTGGNNNNQRGEWSAFATDGKGNWGYGTHWASLDVAKNLAVKGCGGANIGCNVFWTTKDKCVAYAESRTNGWWYAAGGAPTDQQARANALKWCQSGTAPANSCKVVTAECWP